MDARLVAWARAVKARQRRAGLPGHPVLWLFTDCLSQPDPLPSIKALPKGLCGVVLRHEGVPDRAGLARLVAIACRLRGAVLNLAGDRRLAAAVGAGVHMRASDGHRPAAGHGKVATASAHDARELRLAARQGAAVVFLSPVFRTSSHPGAIPLGPLRWQALARSSPIPVLALGGVNGASARQLPRRSCRGAGAITALAQSRASS